MKHGLGVITLALLAGTVGCKANQGGTAGTASSTGTGTAVTRTTTDTTSGAAGSGTTTTGGTAASAANTVTMPDGLKYQDLTVGSGATAQSGNKVSVHYTGWLTDGTKFDSSLDRGQPFEFTLGAGNVIRGWDEGVKGMKVGGKRRLTIPPDLGYGAAGAGGVIPPNATLVFEVELLKVQ